MCLRKKWYCRILAITLPHLNRFWKLFHYRKFSTKPVQNSQHSLTVLLHYLVKCIAHYYCTVNNTFHAIVNNQQTMLQLTDILNTQLVDMLFIMPQIVYATRLRSGLSDVVIWTQVLPAPETRQCRWLCEATVLLKDKELSSQLWDCMHVKWEWFKQILLRCQ